MSDYSASLVPPRRALIWSLGAAMVGFIIAYATMSRPGKPGDFLYWYTAAQALLKGENPYAVMPAIDPQRFLTGFFYPLPAAVLTAPFTVLPYAIAGSLFVGISSGLLALGIVRGGTHRLWIFASAPFIVSAASGTWSIPIAAAAVLPALGFLTFVKPNVGLGTFLYKPTWWMFVGSFLLFAISLMIRPSWPSEWLHGLGGVKDRVIPIFTPAGPLLLLCLTRWRRPEARLLLGYACIPQAPWFYDQLILWVIPATALEAINFVAISQLALAAWIVGNGILWAHGSWFLAAMLYIPPLAMIMRRPNEGELPLWIEQLLVHARRLIHR